MRTWLSPGDFLDIILKLYEKGPAAIASRLRIKPEKRTEAAFNPGTVSSNWWIIPAVRSRWNEKISGKPNTNYESHLVQTHLKGKKGLSLISIGCGVGTHEIELARTGVFDSVSGFDLAGNLIAKARHRASELQLQNCRFEQRNVLKQQPDGRFDVVLFHSSLHHFSPIAPFLTQFVKPLMHSDSLLIVNEYAGPNRLQWRGDQLNLANELLREIPRKLRQTRMPLYTKSAIYRPGWLRMLISDPSEAADSEAILPQLRRQFRELEYRPYGGNLLHLILKDISHHFLIENEMSREQLQKLFTAEDALLESGCSSDYFYGVYRLR